MTEKELLQAMTLCDLSNAIRILADVQANASPKMISKKSLESIMQKLNDWQEKYYDSIQNNLKL
jgi:hypothetical protein